MPSSETAGMSGTPAESAGTPASCAGTIPGASAGPSGVFPSSAKTPELSPLAQRMLSRTTKRSARPAVLMLADGSVFYGRAAGAAGTACGEVCFNTSLEGYFEVVTDPSYAGQIVAMTYPQIGNYGVDPADTQASFGSSGAAARPPALRALVVRDMCFAPSSWRSVVSLPDYLAREGVVAVEGVDTRALVRHLRDHGVQAGVVSTEVFDLGELARILADAPGLPGCNLVQTVSKRDVRTFDASDLPCHHAFALAAPKPAVRTVVAYDCGIKRSIVEGLVRAGCTVKLVPWDTPADDVLAMGEDGGAPDGVFLSNGPGDPDAVEATYRQVERLLGRVPVFGICLGHQMICLACGATMEKLKFGHHGGNHPVMNLLTRRVEITAQNHGFGLVFSSLGPLVPELSGGVERHPAGPDGTPKTGDLRFWVRRGVAPVVRNERFGRVRLTHVNLNDGTAEGIQLLDVPAFSVQYHPEASPGPTDAHYLFAAFARLMEGDRDCLDIDVSSDRLSGWTFAKEGK